MMETFSSQTVTKAAASTLKTSSGLKATGKRKRSDDETTADGNFEQKNNMSATISTRPAKRRRSDGKQP